MHTEFFESQVANAIPPFSWKAMYFDYGVMDIWDEVRGTYWARGVSHFYELPVPPIWRGVLRFPLVIGLEFAHWEGAADRDGIDRGSLGSPDFVEARAYFRVGVYVEANMDFTTRIRYVCEVPKKAPEAWEIMRGAYFASLGYGWQMVKGTEAGLLELL